jgi:hypothetical protein
MPPPPGREHSNTFAKKSIREMIFCRQEIRGEIPEFEVDVAITDDGCAGGLDTTHLYAGYGPTVRSPTRQATVW